MELLLSIGAATEKGLAYIGGLTDLLGRALGHAFYSPLKRSQSFRRASHQAMAVGVTAVPVISFITFFIGVIMALQGAYELRRFGAITVWSRIWLRFPLPANLGRSSPLLS